MEDVSEFRQSDQLPKTAKVSSDDQAWPDHRSGRLAGEAGQSNNTFEVSSNDTRPIRHKQKLDPIRRSSFVFNSRGKNLGSFFKW
jgi:hypothetical protein